MTNSPCVKICSIDARTGYCYGCKRNIKEISDWIKLSENQKKEIILKLKNRNTKKNYKDLI